MKKSLVATAVLLTMWAGSVTAAQTPPANNTGIGLDFGFSINIGSEGGKKGGSGGSSGSGGASVPMDNLGILLIAGVVYTSVVVYKANKKKKVFNTSFN